MENVLLSRDDALDILVAIEEAVHHLLLSRVYALAIALEDGATFDRQAVPRSAVRQLITEARQL